MELKSKLILGSINYFLILIITSTGIGLGMHQDTLINPTEISLEELLETEIVPINVMGSHIHFAGEWMVGYKKMNMVKEGFLNENNSINNDTIFRSYTVAPTKMSVEMDMLEIMYGWNDRLTLMAMLSYEKKSMNHLREDESTYTTRSSGIGDVQLMGHYLFHQQYPYWLAFMLSMSLPTGSIDQKDNIMGEMKKLPYSMQLGLGSVSLIPGMNYIYQAEKFVFGFHSMGTFPISENANEYKLGNQYHLTGWVNRFLYDWLSFTAIMDGRIFSPIIGSDLDLNVNMVPTADTANSGGRIIALKLGMNTFQNNGKFKGNRLELEFGFPLYQSVNGFQLGIKNTWSIGWQRTF
ncbi:MAG: transporter [Candidatus Marinimicrobia bacterium]|nr:transporter [Candidatus Neomarinimicrobiota bacterium]